MTRKFKIITLGCKVNQYESESVYKEMEEFEIVPAQKNESADICIINTCSVTQKAAMQSRQAIRRAVRSNPGAKVIVTGCYAQTEPHDIEKIKGIHSIVGHASKYRITDFIQDQIQKSTLDQTPVHELKQYQDMKNLPIGNRTRPFLKIQDGCNSFCTYCIVPHARGPSRSLPEEKVIENIKYIKNSGFHEVVLTGIHLGAYGVDLLPKTNLFNLLLKIRETTTMDRIRLSSLEPLELNEDILRLAKNSNRDKGKICEHFHIPLQSGDNLILQKMNRPYTAEYFKNLVIKIKKHIPSAAIGVDTLIGFPGETEELFNHTYDLIDELPISYLHVFPFSARKGTPAYKYPDKVDPDVIKKRCAKMRLLGFNKKKAFYSKFIGKKFEILVEGKRDRLTGLLKGLTSNYIPVLVSGDDMMKNHFKSVKITKIDDANQVFGVVC